MRLARPFEARRIAWETPSQLTSRQMPPSTSSTAPQWAPTLMAEASRGPRRGHLAGVVGVGEAAAGRPVSWSRLREEAGGRGARLSGDSKRDGDPEGVGRATTLDPTASFPQGRMPPRQRRREHKSRRRRSYGVLRRRLGEWALSQWVVKG